MSLWPINVCQTSVILLIAFHRLDLVRFAECFLCCSFTVSQDVGFVHFLIEDCVEILNLQYYLLRSCTFCKLTCVSSHICMQQSLLAACVKRIHVDRVSEIALANAANINLTVSMGCALSSERLLHLYVIQMSVQYVKSFTYVCICLESRYTLPPAWKRHLHPKCPTSNPLSSTLYFWRVNLSSGWLHSFFATSSKGEVLSY